MKVLKLTIFLSFCVIGSDLLGWKGNKVNDLLCGGNNNKLLSLLNILCNITQVTTVINRDACYGCFLRAGNLPAGQTQLITLGQCATTYLTNTAYVSCATQLQNVISGIRPTPTTDTTPCYTGYCEFVRCVRKINSNNLIDTCFLQNLVNRNLAMMTDREYFYTNTTSCILAMARCNKYNPITGAYQITQPMNSPKYLFNALQISPTGDLRLITFPATTGVADYFCSTKTTLDQSTYGNAVC